jgi:hypothetical protein
MRTVLEWLLDEKIVICLMAQTFAGVTLLLIYWKADKEYVMLFGGFISMLIGALLRGITHQPQQTDSTQTVSSTTTVSPKPDPTKTQ